MRLKIISDGTPNGTRVMNAKTGEIIEHVIAVDFHIDAQSRNTAKITVMLLEVDLVGDTKLTKQQVGV